MSDLNRSARSMAILTVVSRLTGFARVVVFASVFSKTFLANTYISANTIPNILFELFAAGALQAVLVPTMVRLMPVAGGRGDAGTHDEAERVAGTVLGLLCGLLAVIGLVGILFGRQFMGLLVDDVDSAAVRRDEIELGVVFLLFFMPQLVFYGANVVSTAVLNAQHRFALPVFAPTLNNVVVITCYLWFGAIHEGPLTLDLTTPELWILAGGTTAGVIVFCSLPYAAVRRSGFRLRPRFEHRHPAIRALARDGAWAGVFLALTQVVQVVILMVANREPGALTVYQFAFILFTLPHALFSVPVMTTRFPEMTRSAHAGDWDAYRRTVATGTRSILYMALAATAISVAVAGPASKLLSLGRAGRLAAEVADATIAFAPGIVGFGLLLFFTRAMYATGDARTPALVNLGVVVATSTAMLTVVSSLDNRHLVTGLAAASAAGNLGGAAALGFLVQRRLAARGVARLPVSAALARCVVASAVASAVGYVCARGIGWETRTSAALTVAVAAVAALGVYVVVNWGAGGPAPKRAVATLGAGEVV